MEKPLNELLFRTISWMKRNAYLLAFSGLGIIYIFNMFINVMEVDGAQYASIAREMYENGQFLEVYHRNTDYLDKPPLLFWLSALSFKLFGISNFAYKLPSILIIILGIYSTYKFAAIYYEKAKAQLSALILASSQALLLITNDVRTDGLLLGLVIFTIWQLSAFIQYKHYKYLLLAGVGMGGAMLTKGPIGMLIPALAVGSHLIYKQEWKNIFNPKWLLMLLVVALILTPMCIGLYEQFDLHPEKNVYGLQGPSGLKFFFLTQSFGRLTGDIYWRENDDFFYFFHTILWDFQPWVLIFIVALGTQIWALVKNNSFKSAEQISFLGFIFTFLILSKSNYKLPHYIFPILPFAAVQTAHFLYEIAKQKKHLVRYFVWFQFVLSSLLILVVLLAFLFVFPVTQPLSYLILVLAFVFHLFIFKKTNSGLKKIIFGTVFSILIFGIHLSAYFYPNLLKYQASSQAGLYFRGHQKEQNRIYIYKQSGHALDFYAQQISNAIQIENMDTLAAGSVVYTDLESAYEIMNKHNRCIIIKEFDAYRVSLLKPAFLNKESRKNMLEKRVLVQFN